MGLFHRLFRLRCSPGSLELKGVADTLLIHAHLLTMQGAGVGYIADGALAVEGSRIAAVDATEALLSRFEALKIIDAANCAVLPGLINAHVDGSLGIMRGVAQDVPDWMLGAAGPYFSNMTPEGGMAATRLRVVEELKAGTTTFCDNQLLCPLWGEFYSEIGVRASLAPLIYGLPLESPSLPAGALYTFDLTAAGRALEEAVAFACAWNGAAGGRITTMMGLFSADTLPVELLVEAKSIAQREGLRLHMHVAQGARETEQILKRYGKRPIAFLSELGYLDDQLLAVHLTDATGAEVAQVAQSGAGMALCSGMIGAIDGRVPPARAFREAGGPVGLGGSNHNLFVEMKLTALFNKLKYRDTAVMPAWTVLRMATIEGARAVGLDHKIGSLEVGKEADVIIVDLSVSNLAPALVNPIRNLVPSLVYGASGHEVRSVMVAGKLLVENYQVLTAGEREIIDEAQAEAQLLAERVKADPAHKKLVLMDAMEQGKL